MFHLGRTLVRAFTIATTVVLVGCDDKPAAIEAPGEPSAATTATATATATTKASVAPAEPTRAATTTSIETRDGKKVTFSIVLPPNIREASSSSSKWSKDYRRGEDDFDGYNITVAVDRGEKGSDYEATVASYKSAPKEKQVRLLDSDQWAHGWFVAAELVEAGKKNLTVRANVKAGSVTMFCRGDATGDLAAQAKEAVSVLVKSCRSIQVTPN